MLVVTGAHDIALKDSIFFLESKKQIKWKLTRFLFYFLFTSLWYFWLLTFAKKHTWKSRVMGSFLSLHINQWQYYLYTDQYSDLQSNPACFQYYFGISLSNHRRHWIFSIYFQDKKIVITFINIFQHISGNHNQMAIVAMTFSFTCSFKEIPIRWLKQFKFTCTHNKWIRCCALINSSIWPICIILNLFW